METEVPDSVQTALANLLNAQFELGFKAGTNGRHSIGRKDCLPMGDALKVLVREIAASLAAEREACADLCESLNSDRVLSSTALSAAADAIRARKS